MQWSVFYCGLLNILYLGAFIRYSFSNVNFMDINKHIIDQRITRIVDEHPDWFAMSKDERQKKSKAFVLLAVSTYLGLELEDAINCITEGSDDAGVDAIEIGDLNDNQFTVTIFQGKYVFDLEKNSNFPVNGLARVISAVRAIFDVYKPMSLNLYLKSKVEEIRSLLSDGNVPKIVCICVSNGMRWTNEGDYQIKNAGFSGDQVQFEYINHQDIVQRISSPKGVRAVLRFTGKSIVDDFNYKRVLIGKVNVMELFELFQNHGDALLEKNIRRYLGLVKNRVNESIQETLLGAKRDNFYFYNNGITIVCSQFSYNALQSIDWSVTVDDIQIINGAQSCKTIQQTIAANPSIDYSQVFVLVRLYELSQQGDASDLVSDITIATNSQNPVDLRDLRANDERQKRLELDIKELGYVYKPKKDINIAGGVIPSSVVAEAVFTIWREKPHIAKFKRIELFGRFYEEIFQPLNAAQAIIAVLVYRYCDSQRKRYDLYSQYPHLPYSNYFIAMLMGRLIINSIGLESHRQLSHNYFREAKYYFEQNKEILFGRACQMLEEGLSALNSEWRHDLSPKRLSAFFRRGELLEYLSSNKHDEEIVYKQGEIDYKVGRSEEQKTMHNIDEESNVISSSVVSGGFLILKKNSSYDRIDLDKIDYIKSSRDYVEIYSEGKEPIKHLSTLKSIENSDLPSQFIRCHRSYIVNSNKFVRIHQGQLEIHSSVGIKLIPIGKQYKDDVFNYFEKHRYF